MPLSDKEIKERQGMITPFVDHQVSGGISYGLSSYGYDIRVASEFQVCTGVPWEFIDPKNFPADSFVSLDTDYCIVPPNSFALARSMEYIRVPRDIMVICLGKSTYARCGVVVNVTPLEPCYSDDTEVLTKEGWKLFQDVQLGDLLLTMDNEGMAGYQPVLRRQVYDYDGDMVHFDGRSIDLLVTPDHEVLVNRRVQRNGQKWSGFHKEKAGNVYGHYNYTMSRKVRFVGSPPQLDIGDIPMLVFMRFLGYYLGDGSCYINKGGHIIKLAAIRDRKRRYVEALLDDMGMNFNYDGSSYVFYSKDIYEIVAPLGHAREKYIPTQIKNAPVKMLQAMIDGLMNSDGTLSTETYTTTSPRLADDVQEVFFKAGYAAIVRETMSEGDSVVQNIKGREAVFRGPMFRVRLSRKHLTPKIRPATHHLVPYSGKVYDVTVPNHTLFVRRNKQAVWSGNCWEGHITIEISNTTPLPAKVYANEGIAQLIFLQAEEVCETSYADRKGRYQHQKGIVLPFTGGSNNG